MPRSTTMEAPGSTGGARYAALTFGLLAVLAALAVPLAPVTQDRVTLTWPATGSETTAPSAAVPDAGPSEVAAAAIPLLPYQPVALAATVPCPSTPADTVLLSTVPPHPAPGAPLLPGLRVERADGRLVVSSGGSPVASVAQPAGSCTLQISSDPERTSVTLDGRPVGEVSGDVRPVVAGAFTQQPGTAGLRLDLVTDTRFQTSMTPLKAALAALSGLALLAALLTVARCDARSDRTRRAPLLPRRRWRPRAVDGVVIGGLVGWAAIGPITVDDGYIAGIVRTRDENGYLGNLYRWLNAPEAPFGWFYELYHLWAQLSLAPLWLRVPSTVLGVVCWVLLSRGLLPRLGALAARPGAVWVAAAVFGAWWLPFNLGLRSEPWIAVAGLVTLLAVERTVVTRRVLPLLVGLVVAAAATAVAPTGIVAFAPLLAGLVPLLRALRRRPDLAGLPLLVLLVAAPSSALLLAFGDQTLAAVAEATRVRAVIGGGVPWHQEIERYANLLTPGSLEGALQRRVPVLLSLLGLAGVVWFLSRRRAAGLARGPVTRVALTFGLSLAALMFTPTKWTYHFGALAGVGSAVLVVALYAWSRPVPARASASPLAAGAAGTAAVAVAGGLALAGFNQWPYVSNYAVTWSTLAPQLGGVTASTVVLTGGLLLAAVAGVAAARARAADRPAPVPRWLPAPGLLALGLVVATVGLQLSSVARAAVAQRDGFSMAADSVATLAGPSCGLTDHLRVETDPRAGLLAAAGPGEMAAFEPVSPGADPAGAGPAGAGPAGPGPAQRVPLAMAGVELPGWAATGVGDPIRGRTPWYHLANPGDTAAAAVVVVTVSGQFGPGTRLAAEFGRAASPVVTPVAGSGLTDPPGAPAARDIRIAVPEGADLVRLLVTARRDPGTVALSVSPPRSPRTEAMRTVLPPGTRAVVDWPVAFLHPCLEIAGTPGGIAELPRWQVGTATTDDSGGIVTAPGNGGPFVTPRALVRVVQIPVYLDNDPLRDVATLYRWEPVTALGAPGVTRSTETVPGWQRRGHLHVPGVTQPGGVAGPFLPLDSLPGSLSAK